MVNQKLQRHAQLLLHLSLVTDALKTIQLRHVAKKLSQTQRKNSVTASESEQTQLEPKDHQYRLLSASVLSNLITALSRSVLT